MSGEVITEVSMHGQRAAFEDKVLEHLEGWNDIGDLPSRALIGGFAVSIRLHTAHRATGDVDTTTRDRVRFQNALIAVARAEVTHGRVALIRPGPIPLDAIQVPTLDEAAAHAGDFTEGRTRNTYSNALTFWRASACRVHLFDLETGKRIRAVLVDVATAGTLIAAKVTAQDVRARDRAYKLAADAYDIYRLAHTYHPEALAEECRDVPRPYRDMLVARLRERFDRSANATVLEMRTYLRAAEGLTAEQLLDTVGPFADALAAVQTTTTTATPVLRLDVAGQRFEVASSRRPQSVEDASRTEQKPPSQPPSERSGQPPPPDGGRSR